MVTAVAALALIGSLAQPAPASARKLSHAFWGDLFGGPPKPRRIAHAVKVPLPKPRPPEAPKAEAATEARGEPEIPPAIQPPAPPPAASSEHKPSEQATAPAAPEPSACRQALTEDVAIAPSLPPIHDPGGCGGEDLVRLEAIVLPDKHRVAVSPAATLRCPMATAIADWVRTDIAPLAQELGSRLAGLDNFESYECRNFNGVKGAHLSEHGHANALDVHGFKLADGREIVLTDRDEPRSLREDMLHSACTRFTTVLGPDSDFHHEDHIHLDLMERHNNYRICQWDVLDPLPKVAPLMPSERPAEAPPRQVATKEESKAEARTKDEAGKPEEAKPAAGTPKPTAQELRRVGKAKRAHR
ncbi:extensin family protein [Bradyrhizobium sp. STM 3562]|uniref:extensin family protein n=1 Tax=Bradyrhizobium sp. STM 3562 TaxID=578924 RepID=UPI00388FD2DF